MELVLQNQDGDEVAKLADDHAMLGAYPVMDFYTLFVNDGDGSATYNEFEDTSRVEKMVYFPSLRCRV